ncbi:MAG: hypothetical protein K2M48_04385 [Clostridiales bacterium]|nr:hypothetical protein [Clostridiales bacterium]
MKVENSKPNRRVWARILAATLAVVMLVLPLVGCSSDCESPDLQPHLISKPDVDPVRPIDGFETAELSDFTLPLSTAQYRARVEELYQTVVDLGKKPVFREDDPVADIYDAAVEILDRYVLNDWHGDADGEYRKVHTIHDWLVYYVDYDFGLYEDYRNGAAVDNDPAFDIDGVFLNRRAVCNGLSRATAFLCAIEGIRSMRVTGSFLGILHAWNKVSVGGKWYNIDVTADMANYTFDRGATYKKQLTHGYFMLSDKTYKQFSPNGEQSSAHRFSNSTVETAADYDYYTGVVSVDDEQYPMTITSQKQLNDLFYDIGKLGGSIGKIEVKLSFPNKEANSVNSGDIYAREIREAYTHLNSPDFSISDNGSSVPYVRYPNGVYLFLMYF